MSTPIDDDLELFAAHGASLPDGFVPGRVEHDGASLWYAEAGSGPAVLLLHGGLGHAGNWALVAPALVAAGYCVVALDSRGHGRSSRDTRPYSYELLAGDALAVLDTLQLPQATIVGWSDGAATALVLARRAPARVAGVYYFACNMDDSGTHPFVPTPVIDRCFARHRADYAALSATPAEFDRFVADVGLMQRTQPNYSAADLAEIAAPVLVAQAERDEFIRREHAEYLAHTLPAARLDMLPGVSHFAPLQRPEIFAASVLGFLAALPS